MPILDIKEKTLLIQLATGSRTYSQNLFAPWNLGPVEIASFSRKDDAEDLNYDVNENMEDLLINPQDIQPDEVDVVNDIQSGSLQRNNHEWICKENGNEQQPSTSILYSNKKVCLILKEYFLN